MGPAILLTLGVLFQMEALSVAKFDHTWPILLLVIGGVKLMQSTGVLPGDGSNVTAGANSGFPPPPSPPTPPVPPVPPSEVSRG
jgi:hypothetical protein